MLNKGFTIINTSCEIKLYHGSCKGLEKFECWNNRRENMCIICHEQINDWRISASENNQNNDSNINDSDINDSENNSSQDDNYTFPYYIRIDDKCAKNLKYYYTVAECCKTPICMTCLIKYIDNIQVVGGKTILLCPLCRTKWCENNV